MIITSVLLLTWAAVGVSFPQHLVGRWNPLAATRLFWTSEQL